MLTQKYLKSSALKLSSKILNCKKYKNFFLNPYKHIIVDNAIDNNFANLCLRNFPELNKKQQWEKYDLKPIEMKYRSKFAIS